MGGPAEFDRLGDLIVGACGPPPSPLAAADAACDQAGGRGGGTRDPARLLGLLWTEMVGDEVAANARPVQLRQGRLVVTTSSSAWAQSLQLMSSAIVARVNDRLGEPTVDTVIFRHAGWEGRGGQAARSDSSRAGGGAPPPALLSAEEEAVLAEVRTLGLEPRLEETIVRALRASFARG
jgi:hypothetical protein